LETVYDTLTAFEKIGLVMDLPMDRQNGTSKSLDPDEPGLRFDIQKLNYRTPITDYQILEDVSFSLHPGEKLVLTGQTGSGKSTLLHLMAGLYNDYKGKIMVNGLPIESVDLGRFRSLVGDSFTEESIFSGTIRENIRLGKDIEDNHILEIIELVGLRDYIFGLQDDLETMLLPEGKGLSKTVVNAIIMARCLSSKPKILLLEELVADLEPTVKKNVLEYIMKGSWTVVIISDDEEIQKMVQRVIELNKGRIVFDGPGRIYLSQPKA
jgi:ABC-type bacteriocin/lantibiotic exporter with double-glycine peptidase domain